MALRAAVLRHLTIPDLRFCAARHNLQSVARDTMSGPAAVSGFRGRSDSGGIRTPVRYRSLDVFAAELFSQTALHQRREFRVTGKAQAHQLRAREFANARAQRLLQHRGKPETLFQANHAVLYLQRICPYEKHGHTGGGSHNYHPSGIEARKAHKLDDGADEGNRRHGNDEEMKRRVISDVVGKALLLVSHRSPLKMEVYRS